MLHGFRKNTTHIFLNLGIILNIESPLTWLCRSCLPGTRWRPRRGNSPSTPAWPGDGRPDRMWWTWDIGHETLWCQEAPESHLILSMESSSDVGCRVGTCWAMRSSFSMWRRVVFPALSRPDREYNFHLICEIQGNIETHQGREAFQTSSTGPSSWGHQKTSPR